MIAKHTHADGGAITGLSWSPISNLLAFTADDGTFSRWQGPVSSDQPSPFASEVQEQKRVERLLDDFPDDDGDDVDMEDRGEELDVDLDDPGAEGEGDWIVDDRGDYEVEKQWGKGRQEVGASRYTEKQGITT